MLFIQKMMLKNFQINVFHAPVKKMIINTFKKKNTYVLINMLITTTTTLPELKKICKFMHIKKYTGLKKINIILMINKHLSILKIQRWIRKKLSKNESCPISMDRINYPCFVYKPIGTQKLIYYNLSAIKNFLIKSGDFRDPISRDSYTEENLQTMDIIDKYYHKYEKNYKIVSVCKASKNTKFYLKMKEKECELLTFERILDAICQDIKELIAENPLDNFMMNAVYLHDYRIQFRRLLLRSLSHAEYVINKNIDNINASRIKEFKMAKQYETSDNVTHFLYQLREELYILQDGES